MLRGEVRGEDEHAVNDWVDVAEERFGDTVSVFASPCLPLGIYLPVASAGSAACPRATGGLAARVAVRWGEVSGAGGAESFAEGSEDVEGEDVVAVFRCGVGGDDNCRAGALVHGFHSSR
jgi:hypothetical protein